MFWLLGTGSNHGNTKTAKHTGGKERLGREEGETGGDRDSQGAAGISEQAAGQPLSLTNYAHMRLICIS